MLRTHHTVIMQALDQFNADYLQQHGILFGGGTRIALELDEYRESIDLDFFCPHKDAFRAVRLQVKENSLGQLVKQDFSYPRGIRADRDAVRCFICIHNTTIKLEFISFADYDLQPDQASIFPVPYIDRHTCFFTKLLANADRYADPPFKDIFDLLVMTDYWGEIPQTALLAADKHYGQKVVINGLVYALEQIDRYPERFLKTAVEQLSIDPSYAEHLRDVVVIQLKNDNRLIK